jgi:hypothetical protein
MPWVIQREGKKLLELCAYDTMYARVRKRDRVCMYFEDVCLFYREKKRNKQQIDLHTEGKRERERVYLHTKQEYNFNA